MGAASNRDALLRLLAPVVSDAGVDLEDVQVTPAGKRRLVRVVVDADGGVGLDRVASVSTAVSTALDDSDAMGGSPYVLEVTSPGVDRPLTEQRHWRRARSRLVEARLADDSTVRGRVVDADDAGVVVDVDGADRRLPWPELVSGRVQVEFNRAATAADGQED
jgi:ribosome maturation factor RimP